MYHLCLCLCHSLYLYLCVCVYVCVCFCVYCGWTSLVAVCCRVQRAAMCCNVLLVCTRHSMLQCAAVRCSALRACMLHVIVCCNMLQYVVLQCAHVSCSHAFYMSHTWDCNSRVVVSIPHCNTLQHTATRCNVRTRKLAGTSCVESLFWRSIFEKCLQLCAGLLCRKTDFILLSIHDGALLWEYKSILLQKCAGLLYKRDLSILWFHILFLQVTEVEDLERICKAKLCTTNE